jgi:hypothetical protein
MDRRCRGQALPAINFLTFFFTAFKGTIFQKNVLRVNYYTYNLTGRTFDIALA